MKRQQKLLFIYTNLSTFVKGDLDALQPYYQVTTSRFNLNTGKQVVLNFIKQFFWLLIHIRKFKKIYIWFGDYHSFLPVLFAKLTGKSSYLVVGGYDVCRIRSLKYGSFKNPVRGFMTRFTMQHCTLNLCVSRYVERKVKAIAPKAKTILIYNGTNLRPDKTTSPRKENIVLTVASVQSEQTFLLKGLDRFLEAARQLPEYKFIIVGMAPKLKSLVTPLPENITIHDKVPQKDLIQYYQSAKVYCQLSRTESFCMTLVEGMLYNCIPIITCVGGMPEIMGPLGYAVPENQTEKIVQAIRDAMLLPYSTAYEERIEQHFLLSERQEKLVNVLRQEA